MAGLTYSGKVVDSPSGGKNPAEKIETDSSDPNYLAKVANKKPSNILDQAKETIKDFGKGLYSWPFDLALCLAWIAGCLGPLGSHQRSRCREIGTMILGVLDFALTKDGWVMFRVIFDVLMNSATAREKTLHAVGETLEKDSAVIAGRVSSGLIFSAWLASRGRWGAALTIPAFIAASFGSFVHVAISQSNVDWQKLVISWLTGNPHGGGNSDNFSKLLQESEKIKKELNDNHVEFKDYQVYKDVIEKLVKFGREHG